MADRSALAGIDCLNVPRGLRPVVEEIVASTDEFCAEHLDAEYARLCSASPVARLIPDLAAGA